MRKMIVAGNWKMNTTLPEGQKLAEELTSLLSNYTGEKDIIIAPPFTHLHAIGNVIAKSPIHLSAQNCASEESGAYTGEVAPSMIASTGAQYVILGHSERREYFEESDEILLRKTQLTLKNKLKPIFCIGEQLTQRESEQHEATVKKQLEETVFKLSKSDFQQIILAYEPVWAIGTGKVATPEQAQEMHAFIRKLIRDKFDESTAENMSILYGGSCKPANAAELFGQQDVDGGLIGGASLKADDFYAIINA
ncbi:Bifunctional PGK/TIM [Salinivirga cyanobacteriivorans]|uniref:Triosephosphate isomerase n=1 Tax=Salinivirga cyanobacteriivorans TaxID=1307839 RepID=A0A0S2HUI6_9BACT|nr:triose-phosphate isomerase [Salinivirga cyanobacteriivorans]ALO13714.1 Bifunctional PGK/TIM [Salinivirga cyanobacteriivorans]